MTSVVAVAYAHVDVELEQRAREVDHGENASTANPDVAALTGIRMTKQIFAGGVVKIVPFVGALASGGITAATTFPMSRRLQKHLAILELTKPNHLRTAG